MSNMKDSTIIPLPLKNQSLKLCITWGLNFADPLADFASFIPMIYKFGDANIRFHKQKIHCSVLAEDAIKAAINDFRVKNGMEAIELEKTHH